MSTTRFPFDFFLSRRGAIADLAREVADVLEGAGYQVTLQDYDFKLGSSFIQSMHDAIKTSRDLIVLYTDDYEKSPHTRKEFTSFQAESSEPPSERYVIVLRCEDVRLRGLFSDIVYQDLVGVDDAEERRRRILAAARRQTPHRRAPPRPFIGVPACLPGFIGRLDALERLDSILARDAPAAVTQMRLASVQGMGGVGKTSLAIEYAHRYRSLFAGVWWCPAETRTGLLTSLAALAVALGVPAPDAADVAVAAKAALSQLATQRAPWLLIYDNVNSPDQITDLLPSAGASVLITSRFSDWVGIAEEVPLDVLPLPDSVSLLQRRAGRADEDGARELAETLGRLPLALDHAAATCRRAQLSFAAYAAIAQAQIAVLPRGVLYPRSVAVTFRLAIAEAVTQSLAASRLMDYMAYCATERIPLSLVEGAISEPIDRSQAIAALAEVSLIKHDPFEDGTPAITVHRLVQAVARSRGDFSAERGAVASIAKKLLELFPDDGFGKTQSWPTSAQLIPHVLAARTHGANALSPELLRRAGNYLHWRASYSLARELLQEALASIKANARADPLLQCTHLVDLAGLYWDEGDLVAAQSLFEEALRITEAVSGPYSPATARTLSNLGGLLRDQGKLSAARPLLERALAIREAQSAGSLDTATALTGLGLLCQEEGSLEPAHSLLERALAIREAKLDASHPNVAHSRNNLAEILRRLHKYDAAIPLFSRALSDFEGTLGQDHPNTHRVRSNLARIHLLQGDLSRAVELIKMALAGHDRRLGKSHRWTLDSASIAMDALEQSGLRADAAEIRATFALAQPNAPKEPHSGA